MDDDRLEPNFRQAIKKVEALTETSFSAVSLEYYQLHAATFMAVAACLVKVQQIGLFSPNEDLDDVATPDVKYFNLDYYAAYVLEKTTMSPGSTAIKDRVSAIKVAVRKYIDFLILTSDYHVERPGKTTPKERLVSLEALLPNGKHGLFDLSPLYEKTRQINRSDQMRKHKIEAHKMVEQFREDFAQSMRMVGDDERDNEDALREMEIARLRLHIALSWEAIKSSLVELEMFRNMLGQTDPELASKIFREDHIPRLPSKYIGYSSIRDIMTRYRSVPLEEDVLPNPSPDTGDADKHEKNRQALLADWSSRKASQVSGETTLAELGRNVVRNRPDMTTKVEMQGTAADHIRQAKSVLGPNGQVQRPFTIVNSRDNVARSIYGTGQRMPTMTIEEVLQKELANSLPRELKRPQDRWPQSEDEEDDDSDRDSVADAATEKARRWDDFTEANPKGSGNTMNLG